MAISVCLLLQRNKMLVVYPSTERSDDKPQKESSGRDTARRGADSRTPELEDYANVDLKGFAIKIKFMPGTRSSL
jgi:hypothetical protein